MKITEALSIEHGAFRTLLDQVELELQSLSSLGEVQLIARLVEGCLRDHARSEEDVAFPALDHALEHQGQLHQLYEDHQEINVHFDRVHDAKDRVQGLRVLRLALRAVRQHFDWEENVVFPLLEETLQQESLCQLGSAVRRRELDASSTFMS
jgi:hemerythrin-like domain-containing protein